MAKPNNIRAAEARLEEALANAETVARGLTNTEYPTPTAELHELEIRRLSEAAEALIFAINRYFK